MAKSLPFTAADASSRRAPGMAAFVVQLLAEGLYASTVANTFPKEADRLAR